MKPNVSIKKSKINKKGLFTTRGFKKGEVILKWHPKILTKPEVDKLPENKKRCIDKIGKNKYFLHQAPERFVNHSCEPNSRTKNKSDIAIRNIEKGEEITTNYGIGITVAFKCACGSKKCKKIIK